MKRVAFLIAFLLTAVSCSTMPHEPPAPQKAALSVPQDK
jgi:hypothetical protein